MGKASKDNRSSEIGPGQLLCPKCGFPNKSTSKNCMYCSTSLTHTSVSISILRYIQAYVEMLRWRSKWNRKNPFQSSGASTWWGKVLTFAICIVLLVVGGSMFISSVSSGSFFNFLISVFCLSYGGFALYKLVRG